MKSPVDVENVNVLLDIILLVATSPFIVVVRVLPLSDWVKLLIRFVIPDVMPLIKTANELVVVASELELINETGADCTPFTKLVKELVAVEIVFVVPLAIPASAAGDNTNGPLIMVVPFKVVEAEVSEPVLVVEAVIF